MYQTILRHKEIDFCNDIPGDVMVYADADLFCCVIRNLLSNAIKYTPASGMISIVHGISEGMVTVVVEDSGTGIAHADVNSVFSGEIASIDGLMQEKGSGLGLRLCKEFVELNGGEIRVESVPDLWTKFFFTVPAAPAPVGRSGVVLRESLGVA
jgi:signal transduction histidine kinase